MERTRIDIERLVHNKILGIITPEEEILLNEWLKEKNHQESFDHLMNDSQLADRYAHYASVDAEKGWKKFVESEDIRSEEIRSEDMRSERLRIGNLLKYAAAILLLFIAGAGYWYSQYTKVTPPEIPEAVQLAMQQSIQSGKQEALSEELRVKSEEYLGKKDNEDGVLSEGEEYLGKKDKVESPAKNSSLFTLHSSLNITSSLTKDQLLAAKRITTKHDKEFWITLDDGTLVHLNYNTRLIYPEKFGRGNRNVILDGEAYFMVAKDRSRPFVVHTPNGDVKVYGTEFNVNTNNSTAVVLVKGSVSVTPTGGKETMLKPGQQATVNGQSSTVNGQWSTVNVENVDVEPYVAWNIGMFDFREWPLERIMNILSRWYGYDVEFGSDKLRNITLSGNFDRYKDISTTLDALADVTELNISIKNGRIIIIK